MQNFMGMGVFQQKEQKMPGAHKIGAAISDPRITGRKFYGHEDFSEKVFFEARIVFQMIFFRR